MQSPYTFIVITSVNGMHHTTKSPQDVYVLAVLDFLARPQTPGFYPRCLLTKHEGHARKLGRPR